MLSSMPKEESTWIANGNVCQALALALIGVVRDGEITQPCALAIADEVLSSTATKLNANKPSWTQNQKRTLPVAGPSCLSGSKLIERPAG
jgi:hypothetical protein